MEAAYGRFDVRGLPERRQREDEGNQESENGAQSKVIFAQGKSFRPGTNTARLPPSFPHRSASPERRNRLMTIVSRGFLFAIALLACGVLGATEHTVHVTLQDHSLSLSDVTPGGKVVLFAMSMRQERGMPTLRRFAQVLTDEDGDGTIVYEPGGGVPLRSVWVAIDLANGSIASVYPAGNELTARALSGDEVGRDAESRAIAVREQRLNLDVLLVRPGTGVWIRRAREGGSTDSDHSRDGLLTVNFSDAQALDTAYGSAPTHLQAGDVVAAIDPARLELLTLTVAQ
jgi:hypothetical protein